MVGFEILVNNNTNGTWLSVLLRKRFFDNCNLHQNLPKAEENGFCIDCEIGFCRHCLKNHVFHERLQICKYCYHDVVRLQEIQKYFDCFKIQTYKINGEKAVHLNKRPRSKDAKPSTKAKIGSSCESCGRYLQDQPNRFCSIACKVSIMSNNKTNALSTEELPELSMEVENEQEKHSTEKKSTISFTDAFQVSSDEAESVMVRLKPSKEPRKRKGIPLRAPLC